MYTVNTCICLCTVNTRIGGQIRFVICPTLPALKVNLNLRWSKVSETNAVFQPARTGFDDTHWWPVISPKYWRNDVATIERGVAGISDHEPWWGAVTPRAIEAGRKVAVVSLTLFQTMFHDTILLIVGAVNHTFPVTRILYHCPVLL